MNNPSFVRVARLTRNIGVTRKDEVPEPTQAVKR